VVNLTSYFQDGWLPSPRTPSATGRNSAAPFQTPHEYGGDSVQIYGYGFGSDSTKITVKIGGANAAVQKVETLQVSLRLSVSTPAILFHSSASHCRRLPVLRAKQTFSFRPPRAPQRHQIISVLAECSIVCETWFLHVSALRSKTAASLFNEHRSRRYFLIFNRNIFLAPLHPPGGPPPNAGLRGLTLTPDGSQLIVADFGAQMSISSIQ